MSVLPEIQFSKVSVCKYDDGKATHIIKHEVIPHHINDVLNCRDSTKLLPDRYMKSINNANDHYLKEYNKIAGITRVPTITALL